VQLLQHQMAELKVRYTASRVGDRVQAEILREEIRSLSASLRRSEERLAELTVLSPSDGRFVLPEKQDLPGRYLRKGELLGYVVDPEALVVRAVVAQDRVDLVRQRTRGVQVRLAEDPLTVYSTTVRREVPGATRELPSAALSTRGGGTIALDPTDNAGKRAFQRLFHFELELPAEQGSSNLGTRAYVRFDHGYEPLLGQSYRSLRQLLLKHFDV